MALMFIDLDRFKPINDTFGHDAGDHVLVSVSTRLSKFIRETDFIARVGGDEFVIIIEHVENLEAVEIVAKKILEKIQEPIDFNGNNCSVGASIGISLFPDHAPDEETLLRNADTAMYSAKEAGRNNFRFYSV
jgi:diguanylate cyclase (GGDEF)-like protein